MRGFSGIFIQIRDLLAFFLLIMLGTGTVALADEEPILRLDTGGHQATVKMMAFSPDGRELYTAANDKTIMVWDTATGQRLRVLRGQISLGPEGKYYALDLSPDGKTLAAGGYMKTDEIRLLDAQSGAVLAVLSGHSNVVLNLKFSPDGKTLASSSGDKTVRLWNVDQKQLIKTLEGHTDQVYGLSWHPHGQYLASAGHDGRLILWDAQSGKKLRETRANEATTTAGLRCAFSPDGEHIATGGLDGRVVLWDGSTLSNVRELIDLVKGEIYSIAWHGDQLLAGGYYNEKHEGRWTYPIIIFDTHSGQEQARFWKHSNTIQDITVGPDKNPLVASTGGDDNETWLWNPKTMSPVHEIKGKGKNVVAIDFGNNGQLIGFGNKGIGSTIKATAPLHRAFYLQPLGPLWENQSSLDDYHRTFPSVDGKTIKASGTGYQPDLSINGHTVTWPKKNDTITCFTYTPDGETAVVGSYFALYKFNGTTGERTGEFISHEGTVWAVSPSPDGTLLLSGSDDQTIKLWDIESCELLTTLFIDDNNEWVMWTPSGYYASSANGGKYIGWHINRGEDKSALYYTVDQFAEIYDRPDIVKETLRLRSEERGILVANQNSPHHQQTAPASIDDIRPPEITFLSPNDGSTINQQEVTVRYKIESLFDLEEVSVTVNGLKQRAVGRAQTEQIDNQRQVSEEITVTLDEGENRIVVFARHNKAKATATLRLYGPEKIKTQQTDDILPRLYVVAIGVDRYEYLGAEYQLDFPDDDARDIAAALKKLEGKLYREVHCKVLAGKDKETTPTRRNIVRAMKHFSEASQYDTCVLFIAGHGVQNSKGTYYFVPSDGEFLDRELDDSSAVLWATLKEGINVPGRRIMLVDTCHAAGASGFKKRAINQDSLIKELRDESTIIMTSCQSNQSSLEHPDWGHGAFTKALLDGMVNMEADLIKNNNITIKELDTYISEKVPALTNGAQHPKTFTPEGYTDFTVYR